MSDDPLPELQGRTPLMAAHTPNLDRMVLEGIGGWSRNTPAGFYPGSDVANLGVLGYDVRTGYTGRSPLEAAAMGVELQATDVAFRCNFVTLAGENPAVMKDFSAGQISTSEGAELIAHLNQHLQSEQFCFYPGVGYRHLLVWHRGGVDLTCVAPHDITDRVVTDHLPQGPDSASILELMLKSRLLLTEHPINRKRREQNHEPANSIWLWGHGRKPNLPLFQERFSKTGGVISAVDLMRGIARHIGFKVHPVVGATGWIDTNYQGKAQACLAGLQEHDLMFIHVESPDEAGHAGRLDFKLQAIEDFDAKVVGPVLDTLRQSHTPFRAIALPDHPTPLAIKTHNANPVPFALCGTDIQPDHNTAYNEHLLQSGSLFFDPGYLMMNFFLGKQ
ncbi:MAG: cofactor-independent phosphoglycerate mutase [Magnetococcus sp. DMHC-6]